MRKTTMMQSQWKAVTQTGENLKFQNCKGGYFSAIDDYGLKVIGKTSQDEKCVKIGTNINIIGGNLFDISARGSVSGYTAKLLEKNKTGFTAKMNENPTIAENITPGSSFYSSGWLKIKPYINGVNCIKNLPVGNVTISFDITYSNPVGTDTIKKASVMNVGNSDAYLFQPLLNTKFHFSHTFNVSEWTTNEMILSCNSCNIEVENFQMEIGNRETPFEHYQFTGAITTPCDLYENDIWYPMTGKVKRNDNTTELYEPQPCFTMPGTINVIQNPLELPCELSAAMLVRR